MSQPMLSGRGCTGSWLLHALPPSVHLFQLKQLPGLLSMAVIAAKVDRVAFLRAAEMHWGPLRLCCADNMKASVTISQLHQTPTLRPLQF